jgi:L-fuconolactonase
MVLRQSVPGAVPPVIDASDIRVVDTHVHVWTPEAAWMAWLSERPTHWDVLRREFSWNDLRRELDQASIADLILVQTGTAPVETQHLLIMAAPEPSVLGVVGWTSLKSAHETAAQLASFCGSGQHKLVGIRSMHGWKPDGDVLDTPQALDSCRLLVDRQLALDLLFPDHTYLHVAVNLIRQVPEGTYVINHLGKPALDNPDAFIAWSSAMAALSEFSNVYVKYSGWATFVRRTQASDVRQYIEFVLDKFTPERVMFGSNWPVALIAGSYQQTYRATLDAISQLSAAQRYEVLRGTALRCYLHRDG